MKIYVSTLLSAKGNNGLIEPQLLLTASCGHAQRSCSVRRAQHIGMNRYFLSTLFLVIRNKLRISRRRQTNICLSISQLGHPNADAASADL